MNTNNNLLNELGKSHPSYKFLTKLEPEAKGMQKAMQASGVRPHDKFCDLGYNSQQAGASLLNYEIDFHNKFVAISDNGRGISIKDFTDFGTPYRTGENKQIYNFGIMLDKCQGMAKALFIISKHDGVISALIKTPENASDGHKVVLIKFTDDSEDYYDSIGDDKRKYTIIEDADNNSRMFFIENLTGDTKPQIYGNIELDLTHAKALANSWFKNRPTGTIILLEGLNDNEFGDEHKFLFGAKRLTKQKVSLTKIETLMNRNSKKMGFVPLLGETFAAFIDPDRFVDDYPELRNSKPLQITVNDMGIAPLDVCLDVPGHLDETSLIMGQKLKFYALANKTDYEEFFIADKHQNREYAKTRIEGDKSTYKFYWEKINAIMKPYILNLDKTTKNNYMNSYYRVLEIAESNIGMMLGRDGRFLTSGIHVENTYHTTYAYYRAKAILDKASFGNLYNEDETHTIFTFSENFENRILEDPAYIRILTEAKKQAALYQATGKVKPTFDRMMAFDLTKKINNKISNTFSDVEKMPPVKIIHFHGGADSPVYNALNNYNKSVFTVELKINVDRQEIITRMASPVGSQVLSWVQFIIHTMYLPAIREIISTPKKRQFFADARREDDSYMMRMFSK